MFKPYSTEDKLILDTCKSEGVGQETFVHLSIALKNRTAEEVRNFSFFPIHSIDTVSLLIFTRFLFSEFREGEDFTD